MLPLSDLAATIAEALVRPIGVGGSSRHHHSDHALEAAGRQNGRDRRVGDHAAGRAVPGRNQYSSPYPAKSLKRRDYVPITSPSGGHWYAPRQHAGRETAHVRARCRSRAIRLSTMMQRRRAACDRSGLRPAGTHVHINTLYLDADIKILTGEIKPHFMAGFSGGRKAICPGLANLATLQKFHSPQFLENPCAPTGSRWQPMPSEATEVAERVGADFLINVTMDEDKALTGVLPAIGALPLSGPPRPSPQPLPSRC